MNSKHLAILTLSLLICLAQSCAFLKKTTSRPSPHSPDSSIHARSIDPSSPPWAQTLHHEILKMGSFNWIIVAEPAFPSLNMQGVTTIVAEATSPRVLQQVFETMETSGHVKPKVYISRENTALNEKEAPGINNFKVNRDQALNGREIRILPHNALELLLVDAKKKHRILIVKTNSLLPYSSIFVELESGYWDGVAETSLRKRMSR